MATGAARAGLSARGSAVDGDTTAVDHTALAPAGSLLRTKLRPPDGRRELVARPGLLARLDAGLSAKLTLVDAPAGCGKTTLLATWLARSSAPHAAWVSLERDDNDPARFWIYLIEALRLWSPGVGQSALRLLRAPGADNLRTVLPALLAELDDLPEPVVLVLDDYHVITRQEIHEQVEYLIDHLPAALHVAIATRSDPPFRLGQLRVRGELNEIRAHDLRFSDEETNALLNGILRLDLQAGDLRRLQRRTEGWAAGLYLAALSLRGRSDASAFVAEFAGDDRHIVDYLGAEVLDHQPPPLRDFLLRTSILECLCGGLCDAVLDASGSAATLEAIERSNLFLVPLDSTRRWYRYHHLFRELLCHELVRSAPELVAELHHRAAAWYRQAGAVPEAIHHATAGGDVEGARTLIAEHWRSWFNRGRLATVTAWLDALPSEAVTAHARLCLARVWVAMDLGQVDQAGVWIDAAERAGVAARDADAPATTLLRALQRFRLGDLGGGEQAAARALAVHAEMNPFWRTVAHCVLGVTRYWSGPASEPAVALWEAASLARADGNALAELYAIGYLALLAVEGDDPRQAQALVAESARLAGQEDVAEHFVGLAAHLARGRLHEREGRLAEADAACARALELSRRGAARVEVVAAMLALARVRHALGMLDDARGLRRQAEAVLADCPDPGPLAHATRRVAPARRTRPGEPLSERERAVLRLLPGGLSQREIADALYVSLNTVKTHLKGIYLKLDASTRAEAVAHARERGLL